MNFLIRKKKARYYLYYKALTKNFFVSLFFMSSRKLNKKEKRLPKHVVTEIAGLDKIQKMHPRIADELHKAIPSVPAKSSLTSDLLSPFPSPSPQLHWLSIKSPGTPLF